MRAVDPAIMGIARSRNPALPEQGRAGRSAILDLIEAKMRPCSAGLGGWQGASSGNAKQGHVSTVAPLPLGHPMAHPAAESWVTLLHEMLRRDAKKVPGHAVASAAAKGRALALERSYRLNSTLLVTPLLARGGSPPQLGPATASTAIHRSDYTCMNLRVRWRVLIHRHWLCMARGCCQSAHRPIHSRKWALCEKQLPTNPGPDPWPRTALRRRRMLSHVAALR